jgi:hypothetical protein
MNWRLWSLYTLMAAGFASGCAHSTTSRTVVEAARPNAKGYENYYIKLAGAEGVETRANATILKVSINGIPARMLVNEQSDSSAITPELRQRLKLALLNVAEASISDKSVWLDIVSLERIQIATSTFSLSPVIVVDVNQGSPAYGYVDGILGKDFLDSQPGTPLKQN